MSNSETPMTERDFAAKIDWEGGITAVLDYGLEAERCESGELHDAWKKLESKWDSVQVEIDNVKDILDRYQ